MLAAVAVILVAAGGCSPAPRYTIHRTDSGRTASGEAGSAGQAQTPSSGSLAGKPSVGEKARGIASYYADQYNGRKTANGEIFDMYGLTCAHNLFPFDTWLEIKNLSNDRTVIVRVNDRGPFVEGRIIDLSYGAAKELDMLRAGVQEVEITVIR